VTGESTGAGRGGTRNPGTGTAAAATLGVDTAGATRPPSAIAQLAWSFLTDARGTCTSPSIKRCIAASVYTMVALQRMPERALGQMHRCVDHGYDRFHPANKHRLRALARRVFSDARLGIALGSVAGADRAVPKVTFVVLGSAPARVNPKIHLGNANFGAVVDGRRAVERLTATGGKPPYRFYIHNEVGMMAPAWLQLALTGR
jgi:hypothetical protein